MVIAIKEWIEDRGRSGGSRVYIDKGFNINFGFHSNDSSSLTVALENRFSLVDLTVDVKAIGEQAKLVA